MKPQFNYSKINGEDLLSIKLEVDISPLKKIIEETIRNVIADYVKTALTEKDWLNQKEAQELLPLKSKTSWQNLRDSGEISFSKVGGKILYSKKSLLSHIEKKRVTL